MVDTVEDFSGAPRPSIEASRHVSMNEAYFDGHFPGMPLWPGALTMEGLGQSAVLLQTLVRLEQLVRERGQEPERVLETLRNLDRGFRLHPGYRADGVEVLTSHLRSAQSGIAVGAAVEMKFLKPVLPGCRLDYAVELTDRIGDLMRFSAEASVEGEPVARGWITGAIAPRAVMPNRSS
jgi:3-hydroxyacyl-[acyl-carrier-protein] dehydratase